MDINTGAGGFSLILWSCMGLLPDEDISQLLNDSNYTYKLVRIPDVDSAQLLDDSKGKYTYKRVDICKKS